MAKNIDEFITKVTLNTEEAKKQLDVMSKKVEEFRKLRDSAAKEGNGEMAANYAKEIAYFSFSESALFASDAVHLLGEAALRDEVLFQSLQLLEEQVVGLVDEDDGHVGDGFGRTRLAEIHEEFGIVVLLAQPAHGRPFHGILFPLAMTVRAQIVDVVLLEFLQTCLRHIDKFDLGLCRGSRSSTNFNDVLLARTCRLHHLVDSTVAFLQIGVAEVVSHLEDHLCLLVGKQLAVVA